MIKCLLRHKKQSINHKKQSVRASLSIRDKLCKKRPQLAWLRPEKSEWVQAGLFGRGCPVDAVFLLPELLEPIELTYFIGHDMHHDIDVIEH